MTASDPSAPSVLLIGCGRMGSALLTGWDAAALPPAVVVDPSAAVPSGSRNRFVTRMEAVPQETRFGAVVLAVKPQVAEAALTALGPLLAAKEADRPVVLSIMAGRTLSGLEAALPPGTAVVRAMPNTPAAIGRGISVAVANASSGAEARTLCDRLLRAAGAVEWVENEALLDAVTAVSGSGPAYLFLLAELMERAGIRQGLPQPLARTLARHTVAGASALMLDSDEEADALRRAVTSPNGTTAAALSVLMHRDNWPRAVDEAIAAATARSRELAG